MVPVLLTSSSCYCPAGPASPCLVQLLKFTGPRSRHRALLCCSVACPSCCSPLGLMLGGYNPQNPGSLGASGSCLESCELDCPAQVPGPGGTKVRVPVCSIPDSVTHTVDIKLPKTPSKVAFYFTLPPCLQYGTIAFIVGYWCMGVTHLNSFYLFPLPSLFSFFQSFI